MTMQCDMGIDKWSLCHITWMIYAVNWLMDDIIGSHDAIVNNYATAGGKLMNS